MQRKRATILEYPFRASISPKTGKRVPKTWAFAKRGTEEEHALNRNRIQLQKILKKYLRPETEEAEPVAVRTIKRIQKIHSQSAARSHFFIKNVTYREIAIRSELKKAGINVEEPIELLGKGKIKGTELELFQRGRHSSIVVVLHSESPELAELKSSCGKNREKIAAQIRENILRMHTLGITHNHPHMGNWAINPEGEVKLIDLSLAKRVEPAQNRSKFIQQYREDILLAAEAITGVEIIADKRVKEKYRSIEREEIQKILDMHKSKMNTYGTTVDDILEREE